MSVRYHRFGQTFIAKISNSNELRQLLVDPWFESDNIIIKPNWVSTEPANFTDSETLRILLESLDAQILIAESHQLYRSLNLLKEGMTFSVGDKEVNWKWLLDGDGWNWLIQNPDWDWFKKDGHWDQIKKEDKTFLDDYGFTDLLKEFNVKYINVTDEVWSGKIAELTKIKDLVETHFKPVLIDELYSMVPKKLYDLRGSTFISFAKLTHHPSFTLKNIFGMIPDPLRPWWHGPGNNNLAENIVDINKIYHALFNVYGICESLTTRAYSHPRGKFYNLYAGKYNILEGMGFIAFSRKLVSLDAILCNLAGFDFKDFNAYINKAEEELGSYDRKLLKASKKKVGNWLSP